MSRCAAFARSFGRSRVEANAETRLDNLPLVPVEEVEAASRTAESVEDAPASVSVVSSRELRGMAYPTVWQSLSGIRGVYLSDDRGYVTAGFRGFGTPGDYGNRTLVLLNGQPMNDNWTGSGYLGYDLRSDIEDVQRIEVIRGPGSVLYGTGAVSGVINVVTRPHDGQTGYEVGGSTADGTVGRVRARAAYDFGNGAGMWISAAASHSSGNAYYFPEYASDGATHGNAPANTDRFNAGTITGQLWWKALTVQWSANSHDKHLPTGEYGTLLGDDRTHQIRHPSDDRGALRAEDDRHHPVALTSPRELLRVHGVLRGDAREWRALARDVQGAVGGRGAALRLHPGASGARDRRRESSRITSRPTSSGRTRSSRPRRPAASSSTTTARSRLAQRTPWPTSRRPAL